MKCVCNIFSVVLASILMIACNTNQLSCPTSTSIPTFTPSPTDTPTAMNTLAPTEVACPPSPLGQELPLPQDVEGFIGRYYQNPGRKIVGMEFYFYVPIRLDVENRETSLILGDATMGDRHMLWLEKLVCIVKGTELSPQGYSYHQVVDVVELPQVESNYVVDLNSCLVNGILARNTVGMGEVTDESNAPSEPLYAWRVNVEDEKIIPVSTQNMKCYFDFSYPKP